MPERISEETLPSEHGHVERYRWAKGFIRSGDTVLDIACGIGYGAEILRETACEYIGIDKPGIPSATFAAPGTRFLAADIDQWWPDFTFDVAVCFETLEHVKEPDRLADMLQGCTGRTICVSVPIVPTVGQNPWHLHDFTESDIRNLFDRWHVAEDWPQPSERSHVWAFKP